MRALALTGVSFMLWSAAAHADVGVLPVTGDVTQEMRDSFQNNIKHALKHAVMIDAKCDVSAPGPVNGKCLDAAVANKRDLDEVVFATLSRTSPGHTRVALKVLPVGDWQKPALEIVVPDVADVDASDVAVAVVKQAFDPAHYTGMLHIEGINPSDRAALSVDGLHIDKPDLTLSVGHHTLEVQRDGALVTQPFEVQYQRPTVVAVPPAIAAASRGSGAVPAAFADAAAVVALGTLVAGVVVEGVVHASYDPTSGKFLDNTNTFAAVASDPEETLPRSLDPACRGQSPCDGWGKLYGPGPERGKIVSEPARFAMVAVAQQGVQSWRATDWVGISLVCVGAVGLITGGTAAYMLWPE
ncbi:MAG TPA: hypothetical protein VGO62_01140 [Myxococcota bacterium]|jgi:hypothetical protein